jgi:hypothetical protein
MKNLKAKPFAFVLFGAFAVCFLVVAVVSRAPINDIWSLLWIGYKAIPLLLVLVWLFVGYAWRWTIFRNWLVPFPDLNGTWQGTIQTTWEDPETGETPGAIRVFLSIKQSFVTISCVMRTAEMTSRSYFADFWIDSSQQIRRLGYCYHSWPLPSVQHRSPPHDGTMIFEVVGNPADRLVGIYWSSRRTTGEVNLTFRDREVLEEFPAEIRTHSVSGEG